MIWFHHTPISFILNSNFSISRAELREQLMSDSPRGEASPTYSAVRLARDCFWRNRVGQDVHFRFSNWSITLAFPTQFSISLGRLSIDRLQYKQLLYLRS